MPERTNQARPFGQRWQFMVSRFFRLDEHGTSIRTEALAGLTTFLTMTPGMGLNAMSTYMLIHGYGLSWQEALGVIFLSGVFFVILTVIGKRAKIVEVIPLSLRLGIGAGIGIFITLIGLESLRLVVSDQATLVTMGPLTLSVLLGLTGLVIMIVLELRRVNGAILIGMLGVTALGFLIQGMGWAQGLVSAPVSVFSSPADV